MRPESPRSSRFDSIETLRRRASEQPPEPRRGRVSVAQAAPSEVELRRPSRSLELRCSLLDGGALGGRLLCAREAELAVLGVDADHVALGELAL
jgi:hypothetical protein